MRITYLFCLLLCAAACGGSSNKKNVYQPVVDPAALIASGKVFSGEEGVRVTIVELKAEGEALVKVTGSRSDFEGKAIPVKVVEDGTYLRFVAQMNGREWHVVVRESNRFNGEATWRTYLGAGYRGGVKLTLDEQESAALDTVAVYRDYESIKADGTLDAMQRFDRKGAEENTMADLNKSAKAMAEACDTQVSVSVAWDTIDDETLKSLSISSYCGGPIDALRNLCSNESAKAFAKKNVKSVECRYGADTRLEVSNGALTWIMNKDSKNMDQFARESLLAEDYQGKSLQYHINVAATRVCVDKAKGRYIVLAPEGAKEPGLLYGDGKNFTRARTPKNMGEGWFLEPRFFNPKHNENFRGLDLRNYSLVEVDDKAGSCSLRCGTKESSLALLSGKEAADITENLTVLPDPHPREPYALARDRRGNYYYVDRSTKPGEERFFQLYVGKKGNLTLQKMKDIVSDSEGEIFASKKGELRLILDRSQASWIEGKKQQPLTLVPVDKNLQLIYNELGVYVGQRLGTPCDDLD